MRTLIHLYFDGVLVFFGFGLGVNSCEKNVSLPLVFIGAFAWPVFVAIVILRDIKSWFTS